MQPCDIAIVGMSGIFPGANTIDAFWKNIENNVDAIGDVPENRISHVFFDPDSKAIDRIYCKRGGFIGDIEFDPVQFGILPLAVEGTEPDHLITLKLAHSALQDADILGKEELLAQTGIIIGKGNYNGAGSIRAIEIVRTGQQIVQILKHSLPHLSDEDIESVKKEYQRKKGRFGPDTAMGVIPNLVASLTANRLNLGGVAYTLDAACASSLIAIDHAVNELNSKRCHAVIAGGVHICHDAAFWNIFSQLGALSKCQQIRPFDQRADGLLIGEGCGFVVLQRLEDALERGNKIYAVIKGTGVASDGAETSVMSPSVKGQILAITQAWKQAGLDPQQVGYLEAHGTGTQLGDKTELNTLKKVFGYDKDLPKAGIGSVKSMIGHAMPAAGMAGVIKMAKALYHGVIPPTLHCEQPLEAFSQTRFHPVSNAMDWGDTTLPKRVGVNAFGFGGINAHVVMEGFHQEKAQSGKTFTGFSYEPKDTVMLLARKTHEELIDALSHGDTTIGEGDYKLALFDPTPERIKKATKVVKRDLPWRNRQDIWYTHTPLLKSGGKVAFLFSGLDALNGGETDSIRDTFSLPKPNYASSSGNELLQGAFDVVYRSRVLDQALKKLGVTPDINAGHSFGEWLAAWSAELVEEASLLKLFEKINPESINIPETRFIAVGCGYEKIKDHLNQTKDIYLSNDNCPQQVILCGTIEATEEFVDILKKEHIFHQVLPFQSGFHSPFIEEAIDDILSVMELMVFKEKTIPLWSATTVSPYPEEVQEIKKLNVKHLAEPVRFRELILKLHEEGSRMFIQIGSGGLVGFVDDTLKGMEYGAISANTYGKSGLGQLRRVLAALFVEGKADMDLSLLKKHLATSVIGPKAAASSIQQLQLGSPLINHIDSLQGISTKRSPAPIKELVLEGAPSPVMRSLQENLTSMMDTQNEVVAMLAQTRTFGTNQSERSVNTPVTRNPVTATLDISLENSPYLIDHSLMKQKPGWTVVEDLGPVIPFTMIIEEFGDITQKHAETDIVQKLQNIRVFQWMGVASPFQETVKGTWKEPKKLFLDLENYAQADVIVADTYAKAPNVHYDTGDLLHDTISVDEIYSRRMFHGPAYQGIKKITHIGDKGITGIIESSNGKGSLLDNAGQLFGLWLQFKLEKDRIAFPVKVQEIEFFDDREDQAGQFECSCELTGLDEQFATGNIVLKRNNCVWAVITGWQNRRLEIDQKLWDVSLAPDKHFLSEEVMPDIFMFHNAYQQMSSWEFIIRRYFNKRERTLLETLLPNKRKDWIISRVAAKDAIQKSLKKATGEFYYPLEYEIQTDKTGKPVVAGDMIKDLNLSIAHKKNIAVAMAQQSKPVGIDIEEIEERGKSFETQFLTEDELKLVPSGDERPEWITRFWVAKEAYGKSIGKGFQGAPKKYVVKSIHNDELQIEDTWIKTIKYHNQNYIIGWTT